MQDEFGQVVAGRGDVERVDVAEHLLERFIYGSPRLAQFATDYQRLLPLAVGDEPLFYEEWTEEAAALYIQMDNELQALLEQLPVNKGSVATVLDYYESTDAVSLAQKLRSIEAFKGILSPMKEVEGGFVPDFQSRYFTEDFPYGLAFVHRLAHEKGIPSPTIDSIYEWGIEKVTRPLADRETASR